MFDARRSAKDGHGEATKLEDAPSPIGVAVLERTTLIWHLTMSSAALDGEEVKRQRND